VRPGDRVAYVGAVGPEFAEVMYGAAKCRAIFTAVNNRLSAREVLAILADAEPRVVVADPAAAPLVAGAGTLGFDCDTLVTDLDYLAWREAGPSTPAGDPGEVAGPDETALILYTSGTTGAPKGVELTGRNLGCALHELHASIELKEGSVCAAPIPFFHIAGLGMLLAANLNGGNLVLEQPADMAGVLSPLIDRKVTHAVLVPTVLQRLLALPEHQVSRPAVPV
jgi:acyl-CoA synthetase (AMP-forming)/AMP-acid ligase II